MLHSEAVEPVLGGLQQPPGRGAEQLGVVLGLGQRDPEVPPGLVPWRRYSAWRLFKVQEAGSGLVLTPPTMKSKCFEVSKSMGRKKNTFQKSG